MAPLEQIKMKNKCKICGNNADSEYCFQHKPKKELVKSNIKRVNKTILASNTLSESVLEMHSFFISIWNTRKHYSEISGTYLGKEPLSIFFHHILPKSKYPEARLDEENIILLSPDEHNNVENDIYKYEKINTIREYLLKKYNLK